MMDEAKDAILAARCAQSLASIPESLHARHCGLCCSRWQRSMAFFSGFSLRAWQWW